MILEMFLKGALALGCLLFVIGSFIWPINTLDELDDSKRNPYRMRPANWKIVLSYALIVMWFALACVFVGALISHGR